MGDYCKLIVSCEVKAVAKEELAVEVEKLRLVNSAYHSDERLVHVQTNADGQLDVIIVGQTKWGDRQKEFLDFLRPFVIKGSGPNYVFAMQFSEYSVEPKLFSLLDYKNEDLF